MHIRVSLASVHLINVGCGQTACERGQTANARTEPQEAIVIGSKGPDGNHATHVMILIKKTADQISATQADEAHVCFLSEWKDGHKQSEASPKRPQLSELTGSTGNSLHK